MLERALTATRMGLREQARRPLLLILLVALPFFFITRAFAETLETPKRIVLPGNAVLVVTMQELHGANMAAITVGFLAGLCGLFILQSALQADRRLVVAGYSPFEAVAPRLVLILSATLLVLAVSLAVTAINFIPDSWAAFAGGNLLVGLIYAAIGALAGALFGRLGGTYFVFFLAMIDIGVVQNPMFGSGEPSGWGTLLPAYGPMRVVLDGAFSTGFDAGGPLLIGVAWLAALGAALAVVLYRAVGARG